MITRKHGGGRKFGVRHLQLVFAFLHSLMDGIGLNGTVLYLRQIRIGDVDGSRNEERLFSEKNIQQVEACIFLTAAVTRMTAPFVVLTLNNKYLSIGLSLLEVFVYCFTLHVYAMTKYYGVFAVCVILSFTQSIRLPIYVNIISKWIPPLEYTRAMVVVTCGATIGRGLVEYLFMIPRVETKLFYALGAFKLLNCAAYFFVGAQDPQTCWILKKAEWNFLCREIGYRRKVHCPCKTPFRSILRTPMLYGLMCSSIAAKWFFADFLHFKDYVPGYDDAVNIANILYPIVQFAAAWGVDVMIAKEIVTRNNIRKICSCFVLWGGSIAICFMCFYSREPPKVVGYFILACYCSHGYVISENAAILDMSPNYAVVIHAIYSFPAWVFAFIKVVLMDPDFPLQGKEPFRENISVWYYTAFIMYVLNYGFLMFGDISWCQFDTFNAVDWRKESQISYP